MHIRAPQNELAGQKTASGIFSETIAMLRHAAASQAAELQQEKTSRSYDFAPASPLAAESGTPRLGLQAPNPTATLTQGGLEHIVARHWATSSAKGAGKFVEGTTARSLRNMINETVENGASRSNTFGRPGQIFEYNFGRQIGTNIDGSVSTQLRVVVGPNGQVITAFPY
jgi:hypothetical protein